MARRKKHQQPTKLNLSMDMAIKRIAFDRATDLGKSLADYVSDLIRGDQRNRRRAIVAKKVSGPDLEQRHAA
jgi:hypothetical protein